MLTLDQPIAEVGCADGFREQVDCMFPQRNKE